MTRTSSDNALGRAAISLAERREYWPGRDSWEEGPDPRRFPGLYDDGDGESDSEGDEGELEWTSLR